MSKKKGYRVDFFTPSGKWKYTDRLVFPRAIDWSSRDPFAAYVNKALAETPEELREIGISSLRTASGAGWPSMFEVKLNVRLVSMARCWPSRVSRMR